MTETRRGRVILREPAPAADWPTGSFTVAGSAETLVLSVETRVYEEITIRRTHVERTETVAATLRHHDIEVTVDGPVRGA